MERNRIVIDDCTILVDAEDFEFVTSLGLSIVRRGHLRHVMINTQPYHKEYLHRVLLKVTNPTVIIDHINNNGLDNRKENLRKTCKVGNALNMRANINKRSGLPKGVYKDKKNFRAVIQVNGLNMHLGNFKTVEAAEAAYNKANQKALQDLTKE